MITPSSDKPAVPDPERICIPLRVEPDHDRLRADVYLSTRICRLSRQRARGIIAAGDLRRRGQALKPASTVRAGETLHLWRVPPDEPEAPEHYETLACDGELRVIDKPAGLAVHPSARYFRTTLTQLLRRQFEPLGKRVPRLCHRLDRETSGVLLLAHSVETERWIKQAFAAGTIDKLYWALIEGRLPDTQVQVDAPLAQGQGLIRIKMQVCPEGLPARTDFTHLADLGVWSLVACRPRSGRTHQIRAHLAHLGCPIVGDKIYGSQGDAWFVRYADHGPSEELLAELPWPRQCLHARALRLPSADGCAGRLFKAPWAADLPELGAEVLHKAAARDQDLLA